MTPSARLIGGMFGLSLPAPEKPGSQEPPPAFLRGKYLTLATARSAFTLLGRTLRPKTVWMPSYLCGVVMGGLSGESCPAKFYGMDEGLQVADSDWLGEVENGDMVVFIDYFGFNQWEEFGALARDRGAWVVEDACQAMLSDSFSPHSHFVIASPRKFAGVPDGGVLLAMGETKLPDVEIPPAPAGWWLRGFSAAALRGDFDRHGGGREWFELFQRFDREGPVTPYAMSELSALLLGRFDYPEMARRRRSNYEFLLGELESLALFNRLPERVVPLGFPIRVPERDRVRQALFEAEIFPPVHWALDGFVPASFTDSHKLAREIMTLPCDQRYDRAQMKIMVEHLRKAFSA